MRPPSFIFIVDKANFAHYIYRLVLQLEAFTCTCDVCILHAEILDIHTCSLTWEQIVRVVCKVVVWGCHVQGCGMEWSCARLWYGVVMYKIVVWGHHLQGCGANYM